MALPRQNSNKQAKERAQPPAEEEGKPDLGTFWGLLILGLAYVHHSTSGYIAEPDIAINPPCRPGNVSN